MRWMHLTEPQLKKAAQDGKLCVIPMGCLEKHGEHLPLGCDGIIAEHLAFLASQQEECVVFPTYWYSQIHEATCFAGAIALPPTLLVTVLEETLAAIAKSGFKKILIISGHGGNGGFLDSFNLCQVDKKVDYTLYSTSYFSVLNEAEYKAYEDIWETEITGHACETETSLYMACDPGRVDLTSINHAEPVAPLKRVADLGAIKTGYWWYADYPENVVGTPSASTLEKGEKAKDIFVTAIARAIRTVNSDNVSPQLQQEFYSRIDKLV